MNILKIDISTPDIETLRKAVQVLRSGNVIAHPTDTCYGLACDATNEAAVEKVLAIKHIKESRGLSVMVTSIEQAEEIGEFSEIALQLAKKFLPGPLTLVVPYKHNSKLQISNDVLSYARLQNCLLPFDSAQGDRQTSKRKTTTETINDQSTAASTHDSQLTTHAQIGIRIPNCSISNKLVELTCRPLITTSANITGQDNPYSVETIIQSFEHEEHKPDLILDGSILQPTPPSTVVRVTETVELIREGAIPWSDVQKLK